jgi:hypothetical protein
MLGISLEILLVRMIQLFLLVIQVELYAGRSRMLQDTSVELRERTRNRG